MTTQHTMTATATLYTYAQLTNPKARQKALEWLDNAANNGDWWDWVYEDAREIGAEISGFDTYRRTISLRLTVEAIEAALRIQREHGQGCDTYQAASVLIAAHDEYHGINGKITLEAESYADNRTENLEELDEEWRAIESEFTKALSRAYLTMLTEELENRQSEEYLAEFAEGNGYTFTASGERVDADDEPLYAAAPELLGALEEAMYWFNEITGHNTEKFEQVVKKARGE